MVLDILKGAGVTVQASTDTSQILRQLHLELKRNVKAEHSGEILGKLKKKPKVLGGINKLSLEMQQIEQEKPVSFLILIQLPNRGCG